MKAQVCTFNQEKALEGAFSVIAKTGCGTDGALLSTSGDPGDGVQQLSDGFDPEISCKYIETNHVSTKQLSTVIVSLTLR